jgi:putative oxidoreductase
MMKSHVSLGLLVVRVGLGVMFVIHGFPKLMGGPELWAKLGGAMGNLGITFAPTFWGFMAAVAEGVGGLFLLLGLAFRPAAALMAFTMLVAMMHHISAGDSFLHQSSRPLELMFVFLALALTGPGPISLDRVLRQRSSTAK